MADRIIQYAIVIILCVTGLTLYYYKYDKEYNDTIYVAMVGPLTGPHNETGKSLLKGINLYLDMVNQKNLLNGRKIKLDIFDDQNKPDIAKNQAIEIANLNRDLAVIGHHYSTCSISAGAIYKQYCIPAITPASTNIKVTQGNDWYFRTVVNDNLQSRFLANFVKSEMKEKYVSIIAETQDYGDYLAQIFEKKLKELNVNVRYSWTFDAYDTNLDKRLNQIVSQLAERKNAGTIFLATHASEGIKLLKLIKEHMIKNPIIAPDAFTSESFVRSLQEYPKEQESPGYYTDDMFVSTHLIFDATNERGQRFTESFTKRFNSEPGWHAAFAYDSIMLIVEAIQHCEIHGKLSTIKEDRKKIRDYLANLDNIDKAIEGVTGYNYFDKNGDAQKPVFAGVYKQQHVISAFKQFQPVPNLAEVPNLENAIKENRIILFDGAYTYKVNTVYTGIEINQINELDLKNLTCFIDFFLWFRFNGNIAPDNIEFLNALHPIQLEKPVDEIIAGDIKYRVYRVRAEFKLDFLPQVSTYKEHVVGISFCHNELDRNNLIYVMDVLGMKNVKDGNITERLKKDKVLNPSSGWLVNKCLIFQSSEEKRTLGSPEYLVGSGSIKYSRFNFGVQIRKNQFSLRRNIPVKFVNNLMMVSIMTLCTLPFIRRTLYFKYTADFIWFLQIIFVTFFMLALEVAVIEHISLDWDTYIIEIIKLIFDVMWWFMPASLLNSAIKRFIWRPLEAKANRRVPNIIKRFVVFLIYTLALFGIIAYVFDQRLTGLLATSGVVAMIIGLAIQINISNIFSGIALNLERPFQIGDWVKVGEFEEAKVLDITWRTTRFQTRDDCIMSLPNSLVSESKIHNYHYPDDIYRTWFHVYIDTIYPPNRVQKILSDAVISSELVVNDPAPKIRYMGLTEWASDYLVAFSSRDYSNKIPTQESVWKRIWNHLNRAGIMPAVRTQDLHVFDGREQRGREASTPLTLLKETDIFRSLSDSAKEHLSKKMQTHRFMPNKEIIKQDDTGDSVYIIVEGVVSVNIRFPNGKSVEAGRLGAGDFFGELAVLTGEPRKATIVSVTDTYLFEIKKEYIVPLLDSEPEVARLFKEKVYQQPALMDPPKLEETKPVEKEGFSKRFISKMSNLFGDK